MSRRSFRTSAVVLAIGGAFFCAVEAGRHSLFGNMQNAPRESSVPPKPVTTVDLGRVYLGGESQKHASVENLGHQSRWFRYRQLTQGECACRKRLFECNPVLIPPGGTENTRLLLQLQQIGEFDIPTVLEASHDENLRDDTAWEVVDTSIRVAGRCVPFLEFAEQQIQLAATEGRNSHQLKLRAPTDVDWSQLRLAYSPPSLFVARQSSDASSNKSRETTIVVSLASNDFPGSGEGTLTVELPAEAASFCDRRGDFRALMQVRTVNLSWEVSPRVVPVTSSVADVTLIVTSPVDFDSNCKWQLSSDDSELGVDFRRATQSSPRTAKIDATLRASDQFDGSATIQVVRDGQQTLAFRARRF